MSIKVSFLAAAVISFFGAGSAHALGTNIVANGDFSGPSGGMATTSVSDWSVTSGDVDVKPTASWMTGVNWAPLLAAKPGSGLPGDQFLDLSGNGPGAISQVLNTVGGSSYSLSFDYAANPSADNTAAFRVSVSWGGGSASQDFTGTSTWNIGSIDFTPDGQTTLAFQSLTPITMAEGPAKRSGALLDNIAVTETPAFAAFSSFNLNALPNDHVTPVPEPETYAMMLLGLGTIGFMTRRRRKA
jgi:hypothetical protein